MMYEDSVGIGSAQIVQSLEEHEEDFFLHLSSTGFQEGLL